MKLKSKVVFWLSILAALYIMIQGYRTNGSWVCGILEIYQCRNIIEAAIQLGVFFIAIAVILFILIAAIKVFFKNTKKYLKSKTKKEEKEEEEQEEKETKTSKKEAKKKAKKEKKKEEPEEETTEEIEDEEEMNGDNGNLEAEEISESEKSFKEEKPKKTEEYKTGYEEEVKYEATGEPKETIIKI